MNHLATQISRRCLEAQFPGFKVTVVESAKTRVGIVGIIGIRSARKFGSVGVAVSESVAASLHPSPSAEFADLCDWVGEMANQVLGRIRFGVGRRGLTMWNSTPTVIEVADMTLCTEGAVSVFRLSDGTREFAAWFDFAASGFDRVAKAMPESLSPGQVVLFD